ncbi:S1 family peptidase [Nocardiopsis sediminis]|uniref:S1 family peptidase n=1 Tax=Nocardiopsis sediminis TaxID=1778267 RepID=A0ABV8FR21_9ACTN
MRQSARKSARKPSVYYTVGGSVLALGVFGAVAVAAVNGAEEAATPQASAEQVSAISAEFGLTQDEATDLVAQQAEAGALESQLREELGSTFGGSWFDIESGDLTVAVTDESAVAQVTEAGAQPKVVTYGEDTLNEMVDTLNAEGATQDQGIAGWYPDTMGDAVVIRALEGEAAAAEAWATEAGLAPEAIEVQEVADAPELYADIIGGDPYFIDSSGRCSIGFATTTGFVTAGHCGTEGTPVGTEAGDGTGTVAGSVFPGSDMGVVEADSNWTPVGAVNDYEGGTIAVAGSEEAPEGAAICRSGSTTGMFCGTVGAKNQSVTYPEGTVNGLTETDVCAEPGDSGGSWISGDQAQGVTSGGSGDCTSGGVTFFQPVNPILEEFGVELVTG